MKDKAVHVAVGVVRNHQGQILIARRSPHVHQGSKWEFPGGKLHTGESVQQALARELEEELGILVRTERPLIQIRHAYADKDVVLDVWSVEMYSGNPVGRENQPIEWREPAQLVNLDFPEANRPIIKAVNLPDQYLITGSFNSEQEFLTRLNNNLARGVSLVQFRAKHLKNKEYSALAKMTIKQCHKHNAKVLLNGDPQLAVQLGADGVHLTSKRLMCLGTRPLGEDKLVAASVHNEAELQQANQLDVDFSVISSVLPTHSHPSTKPIGLDGFASLAAQAKHPVYALGGMSPEHLSTVWLHGGQGIAAIHSLWDVE